MKPELKAGIRVTIHASAADDWAGQHGTVTSIDPATTNPDAPAPVRVTLDGELFPTRFQPSELRPEPKRHERTTYGARRTQTRSKPT
jgi:hypothetical protein